MNVKVVVVYLLISYAIGLLVAAAGLPLWVALLLGVVLGVSVASRK